MVDIYDINTHTCRYSTSYNWHVTVALKLLCYQLKVQPRTHQFTPAFIAVAVTEWDIITIAVGVSNWDITKNPLLSDNTILYFLWHYIFSTILIFGSIIFVNQ